MPGAPHNRQDRVGRSNDGSLGAATPAQGESLKVCSERDQRRMAPVVFVFESAEAEETFIEVAATLDHAPFVSTHTEVLTQQGVLGES